jgi:RNA polymerase sigma-70 factor (ECF subfamily)
MPETRVSLIQRVRDPADAAAWSEFFSIYQPLLIAYVRKRGVNEHDAADVVQEVFARLVPAMVQFEFDAQRGRFRTWLWRVTHNALADWGRRRATRDRAEQAWIDEHKALPDDRPGNEWNQMYRHRILEVVLERVRATSQSASWACFEGRILSERPAAEIARELGVSVNAVYINASRLLARVRGECAELQEPLDSP